MESSNTPRVLARLTSEELALVNGAAACDCPREKTCDQDGQIDTGGYTIDLNSGACD